MPDTQTSKKGPWQQRKFRIQHHLGAAERLYDAAVELYQNPTIADGGEAYEHFSEMASALGEDLDDMRNDVDDRIIDEMRQEANDYRYRAERLRRAYKTLRKHYRTGRDLKSLIAVLEADKRRIDCYLTG